MLASSCHGAQLEGWLGTLLNPFRGAAILKGGFRLISLLSLFPLRRPPLFLGLNDALTSFLRHHARLPS